MSVYVRVRVRVRTMSCNFAVCALKMILVVSWTVQYILLNDCSLVEMLLHSLCLF